MFQCMHKEFRRVKHRVGTLCLNPLRLCASLCRIATYRLNASSVDPTATSRSRRHPPQHRHPLVAATEPAARAARRSIFAHLRRLPDAAHHQHTSVAMLRLRKRLSRARTIAAHRTARGRAGPKNALGRKASTGYWQQHESKNCVVSITAQQTPHSNGRADRGTQHGPNWRADTCSHRDRKRVPICLPTHVPG